MLHGLPSGLLRCFCLAGADPSRPITQSSCLATGKCLRSLALDWRVHYRLSLGLHCARCGGAQATITERAQSPGHVGVSRRGCVLPQTACSVTRYGHLYKGLKKNFYSFRVCSTFVQNLTLAVLGVFASAHVGLFVSVIVFCCKFLAVGTLSTLRALIWAERNAY